MKRLITLLLVFTLTLGLAVPTMVFNSDTKNHCCFICHQII